MDQMQNFETHFLNERVMQSRKQGLCSRIGVHLALATNGGHVEASAIREALLSTALWNLWLLGTFDLGGLRADLAGTRERSVDFSHVDMLMMRFSVRIVVLAKKTVVEGARWRFK